MGGFSAVISGYRTLPRRHVSTNINFRKLALVGKFLIKFSSLSASDKDRRTDSRDQTKKHSAAPPGIEPSPRIFPAGLRCVFSLLLLLLFIGKPQQAFKASLQGARDIS